METNIKEVPNTSLPPEPPGNGDGSVPDFLKSKKFILLAGISIVLFSLLLPVVFPKDAKRSTVSAVPSPVVTQSIELKRAIQEAQNEQDSYNKDQNKLSARYPFIRKMPITTVKYYVYFDVKQNIFIGKLYPRNGEDIEKIKAEATKHMADREVNATGFEMVWQVYP